MAEPLRLVVVRHAQTPLTGKVLNGCGAGAPDPDLDAEGRRQAMLLRSRVPEAHDGFRVVSSPARRAQATAATWGIAVASDSRLAEVDFGSWEGKAPAELSDFPRWWESADFVPPGGTSANAALDEFRNFLEDAWSAEQRSWILVGHSVTIRAAVAVALSAPLAVTTRISVPPAAVVRLRVWPDGGSTLDGLSVPVN